MLEPATPFDEAKRLAMLRGLNILDTPPEERFDRLTRLAKQLLNVPIALVSLVDSNRQWFKSCQGLNASETPRNISFCGHAILSDQIFVIPDASLDPRFTDNPLVTEAPHIRFYAGQPLSAHDGSRLGTLCVIDSEPHHMSQVERECLRDLATIVENELNSLEFQEMAAALLDSQNHLASILDTVLDGIITINDQGTMDSFNKSATNIFGYSAQEVIGKNVNMLMPQPYKSGHDGYLHNYLTTHQPKVIGVGRKVQGRRKNGEIFPMRLAVTEILRQGGNHFVGLVSDISEEEAARERAEADAKKIEGDARFIKALADSLPGLVAYWDKDLRCRFANNAYMEWFGKVPEVVIGNSITDLMGEHLFALNEPYIRAVLAGTPQKFERTLTKADGSIGHTWAHYIPDFDAHGTIFR